MLRDLWSDFRHALRVLRRAPAHTAVVVSLLGIGIGANTAMFSAINHVLVRPLPFPDADRLVRLRDEMTGTDGRRHAAASTAGSPSSAMRYGCRVSEVRPRRSGRTCILTIAGPYSVLTTPSRKPRLNGATVRLARRSTRRWRRNV